MSLLDELLAARAQHRRLAPPSETHPLSLADAYATQDRLREALLAAGERLAGWKAGFTNRATQTMFGAEGPVCGFLLASGVFPSRAEVPFARFASLVVEAEVAFVLRRDLAGPGVTAATALLAVEGLVYELNGAVVATNTAAEVMGSPLNSLAWLANHLGSRGFWLRAREVVMSGSVSTVLRPTAGDTVRATFTRLGSVSVRFV